MNGYFEEINGNKYLMLVPTNESKEITKKATNKQTNEKKQNKKLKKKKTKKKKNGNSCGLKSEI